MDHNNRAMDIGVLRRSQVFPAPPPILTETTQWSYGPVEPVRGGAGLLVPGGGHNPHLWPGALDRVRSLPALGGAGLRPGSGFPTYAWQQHAFVGGPREMVLDSAGLIPVDAFRAGFVPAPRRDPYRYQALSQEVSHGRVQSLQRLPDIAGEAAASVRLDPKTLIEVVNQVVAGTRGARHYGAVRQAALEEAPSKHWQGLLEATGDAPRVANTASAILGFVFDVMKGEFGNHLFRKLVSACHKRHLGTIVRVVAGRGKELAEAAKDKHGLKCVRQLLLAVKEWKPILRELTKALSNDVVGLMMDCYGLELIQTCLNRLDAEQTAFIHEAAMKNFKKLSRDQQGCLALIQCIDHAAAPTKDSLVDRVISSSPCLAQDRYGNYVVQHIVMLRDEEYTERLCRELRELTLQFCRHKHASHVVETCVASTGGRHQLVELVLRSKPELIARDPYGNFVMQTALEVLIKGQPKCYMKLARALMAHAQSLKPHPCGRHVINLLEKQQAGMR